MANPNISTPGEQVTTACKNYQELLRGADFERILNIVLKRNPVFQTEVILGYFEKLKTGEQLSAEEKENLISFAENKNIEEAFKRLLSSFENPLDSKVENETRQQAFSAFLQEIFGENGFEKARAAILQEAGIQTKSQVAETLYSPKTIAWKNWLATTGETLGRIEDDIEINGDIVTVKIPGYKNLEFNPSEYKIGGQKWIDNTNKFSQQDFEKLIEFLGGNNSKGYWKAGANAVPFLRDVLGLKTGRFYWSSDRNGTHNAWGLYLNEHGVVVDYFYQGNIHSAVSVQN